MPITAGTDDESAQDSWRADAVDPISNAAELSLTIECVNEIGSFRSLKEDWHRLYDECSDARPFLTWEWLFSWWQVYGGDRHLRLLVWRSDRRLVGIAPLCLGSEKTLLGTRCRVLRFIGDGTFDSDYLGLLAPVSMSDAVLRSFARWLEGNREWDVLVLRELVDPSTLVDAMHKLASSSSFAIRVEHGRCGVLDLPSTFDEFLQERQPRFRTKIRSLLRKLDQGEFSFEDRCEPRELRHLLRSMFALHQARWCNSGESGVFGSSAKRRFYAHFVPRFARAGWLRLYSLRRGGRYVAHQLCFATDKVTYLLQEGFDASDASQSCGQMLRAAVVRQLVSHGETRYDFLGGLSSHKLSWGAREQRSVHIVLARRRWRGWVYFSAPLWRERIAASAKRRLPASILQLLKSSATAPGANPVRADENNAHPKDLRSE